MRPFVPMFHCNVEVGDAMTATPATATAAIRRRTPTKERADGAMVEEEAGRGRDAQRQRETARCHLAEGDGEWMGDSSASGFGGGGGWRVCRRPTWPPAPPFVLIGRRQWVRRGFRFAAWVMPPRTPTAAPASRKQGGMGKPGGRLSPTDLWWLVITALKDRRPTAEAHHAMDGRPRRACRVPQLWMPTVRRSAHWGAHVPLLHPLRQPHPPSRGRH